MNTIGTATLYRAPHYFLCKCCSTYFGLVDEMEFDEMGQRDISVCYLRWGCLNEVIRADPTHRIPSHQSNQLIEQHLHKKQCGTRYNAPNSV